MALRPSRAEDCGAAATAGRLRERIQDEGGTENLKERDYEILDMMADGIRPILDRLDEIDMRVGANGIRAAPVPQNVRGWLSTQLADSLQGSGGREVAVSRTINDLEAKLPRMIEEAVTSRFHQMAGKLQQEIEETHVRTLESFVKNVQVKLVQRVSALETDMSRQAEAMQQLREYSLRTEDNLGRLIAGVDRLAQDLPKRLTAATSATEFPPEAERPGCCRLPSSLRPTRRKQSRAFSPKLFWSVLAAVVVLAWGGIALTKMWRPRSSDQAESAGSGAAAAGAAKLTPPPASADVGTKLRAAQEYTERKDYSMAEDIYREVLKRDPNNVEVLKSLASALYREDKIDESAAILDKLPKEAPEGPKLRTDIPGAVQ